MHTRKKLPINLLLALAIFAVVFGLTAGPAGAGGNGPPVTVMTRNLYLGADLAPIFAATDLPALQAAVAQVAGGAYASDIPARAAAVAEEIIASEPHLVGLQEAVIWTFGPVQVDFTQLILDALAARGYQYEIVAVATGFDQPFGSVRLEVTDVILARSDLPASAFDVANVQTGNYYYKLILPTPIGNIEIPRQWASVDVTWHGKSFRFVSTHLESAYQPVRVAQAFELLQITAASPLPVVLMGDMNAELGTTGDSAWLLANQGGFADVWSNSQNNGPGFTCCQDPSLRVAESMLHKRIDLILTSGAFRVIDAHVVGDRWIADPADPGLPVLWASDHAGVVAKLFVPPGG